MPTRVTCAQRALDLYRAISHVAGQSIALNNIGWFEAQLGRYERALAYCQQALDLSREAGEHECEALTLDSMGHAHHRLGHHAEAITSYERALQLEQAAGDRGAARDAWRQALAILDELHHPDAEEVRVKLRHYNGASEVRGQSLSR